jgi:hypothetical protein
MTADFPQLEAVYERLAAAIDQAGEGKSEVFLAKVVLKLTHEFGETDRVLAAIDSCLADL